MKQIEFKSALFGQPGIVCQTRSGKKVVELYHFKELHSDWPVFAVLDHDNGLYHYSVDGAYFKTALKNYNDDLDLVMYEQNEIAFIIISRSDEGVGEFEVHRYGSRSGVVEWLDTHQDSLVLNILEIEKSTGKILKQRNF